jgi:outer membrane lipoprotein carrier protein
MNASEIKVFKEQVIESSANTRSITSDFIQFKHLDFLENDIETSGKLAYKAPGLVKWEYTNPYQYSVIFKEDKLLINDGGTKSNVDIGNSKLFKKLNDLIVRSVKGNMFDDEDFEITYFKTSQANKAIFAPKDKKLAGYIASFELYFNKEDGAVLEVKMVEPSFDFTRIIFSNRQLNGTLSDAIFNN